ncbi:unnamed protein product, partial [Scytosiphon promiscuus]
EVSYSVPHPSGDGQLELLSKISGFCKPGEVWLFKGAVGHASFLDVSTVAGLFGH